MSKLFALLMLSCFVFGKANTSVINIKFTNFDADVNIVVDKMLDEIRIVQFIHNKLNNNIEHKIDLINNNLLSERNLEKKVNYLIEKDQLKDELIKSKIDSVNDIYKIRYVKGLQIIKILYEKVLSLDHLFSVVRTFGEFSKMSNPNQYPEFATINELLKGKRDKKSNLDLTGILGGNPIVAIVNTFSNLMVSNLSKEEKDSELSKIECILDFTLRMQNDLNLIYFDTAFLQTSNETTKTDLETLFRDYTKPIGYNVSIKECRDQDDWDTIQSKLDIYLQETEKAQNSQKTKMQINVEFPIDRLIQFITQYNNFIDEGAKFYQKFSIILNSYENEKQCESKLPLDFKKLKSDVAVAIDKFNVAYKPVEVNGSKMKEVLYGIHEFQ